MNTRSVFLLLLLLVFSMALPAQNAPVTTAPYVVNTGPGVTIPIRVTNFNDIGAISLTMDYNYSVAQVSGITPNVNLPGFIADWTTNPGTIIMGWFGTSGVSLPNNSVLVDITFSGFTGGQTDLTWRDNGGSCEYAKYDGGAYNVLNDDPTASYYINGHLTYGGYGPVTIASTVTSAPNQDICIPVKIIQGTNIGAISLTLDYDPNVLVFQSINTSTIPGSWSFIGQAFTPGRLIVGGLGPGFSLPDNSVLFNACFHYNCGSSTLKWWDGNGIACEYADAITLTPYPDVPQSLYYTDGNVTQTAYAPVTTAPFVTVPGPTATLPITVTGFCDIGAISLTLDYDYSIAQVTGVTPNVNLHGFTADWTTNPGRIIMGWMGAQGVTLPDNSVLVDISFAGLVSGGTDLTWFNDGIMCEYARYNGGALDVLTDDPTLDYYKNGHLGVGPTGPITVAPVMTSADNQDICIPVKIYQGSNIGAISLTLDYNPVVLTFLSVNSSTIPGTWLFTGQAFNPGRLIVGGIGSGFSLPDGSVLFNACFHYNCGGTTLAWWDGDGIACEYADATTLNPFNDVPQANYYIDGFMGSTTFVPDFVADNVNPPTGSTVTFTDLTTGSPTSWEWSFDRSSVVFVNGATANSQNPQVQFTEGCLYSVTLKVGNANSCENIITKTGYIHAGTPGLWTGKTSDEWYVTSNWDNCEIPNNLTNVIIPGAAPHWPVYTGNLTIGVQCKTLILTSPTSQLTVTGNLTINP